MSSSSLNAQIGKAWSYHREKRNVDAIREFESILKTAPEDVDALYGLGLALRADGQHEAAIRSFQKALALAKELVTKSPETPEVFEHAEDMLRIAGQNARYAMLVRMLKQRLAELKAPVAED